MLPNEVRIEVAARVGGLTHGRVDGQLEVERRPAARVRERAAGTNVVVTAHLGLIFRIIG